MFKKYIYLGLVVGIVFLQANESQTIINSEWAYRKLLSPHKLSLQWISWTQFGEVIIGDDNGLVIVSGEQRVKDGQGFEDYLHIEGKILRIEKDHFVFDGEITTKVSHINDGLACKRAGQMEFAIKKGRSYWRLRQMDNPCSNVTDYIDIFFNKDNYPLTITTQPQDAKIRILNIVPPYRNGMLLAEGRYQIEVSKKGYQTQKRWLDLSEDQHHFTITLASP